MSVEDKFVGFSFTLHYRIAIVCIFVLWAEPAEPLFWTSDFTIEIWFSKWNYSPWNWTFKWASFDFILSTSVCSESNSTSVKFQQQLFHLTRVSSPSNCTKNIKPAICQRLLNVLLEERLETPFLFKVTPDKRKPFSSQKPNSGTSSFFPWLWGHLLMNAVLELLDRMSLKHNI